MIDRLIRFALVAALVAFFGATHSLQAQPAAALGKPLPDEAMAVGSVSVRVVAGSPASPVIGADVTLLVAGQPRQARTDSSGRAMFNGLPAGATVQAKIADAEGKEVTSEEFPVPAEGGVKLMLTTKPFTGGGGMPAAGGMPEARQMSGQARPDPEVPPGQFVIRLTYNNLKLEGKRLVDSAPPVGETVTLVGYASDDSVTVATAKADDEGHVTFKDLDPTGNTVYFALALLPRNGGVDRLMTPVPIQPDGQMGAKAILSSDKRDATSPAIDELAGQAAVPTPAGKVRITLEGIASELAEVTLVDAATKSIVAHVMPTITGGGGDPGTVQGRAAFEAQAGMPPGKLVVMVRGGASGTEGLANVPIYIVPEAAQSLGDAVPSNTDATGKVEMTGPTTGTQKAVFVVNGRALVSDPFSLEKSGGKLDILAMASAPTGSGKPEALFDFVPTPNQVIYAETTFKGQHYRTQPFQPAAQLGTSVPIVVWPRILFRFSLRGEVDDVYFGVQGRFTIENNSWSPYKASDDGLVIKLPAGHTGGQLGDMNSDVSVSPGEGFRIVRPIAPGPKSFIGAFSLPIDEGTVDWRMDLPNGAYQSGMEILKTPQMTVKLSDDKVKPETVCVSAGKRVELDKCRDSDEKYVLVDDVTIMPKQSMVMHIYGLPSRPAWKIWVPRVVGILVILTIIGGVVLSLLRQSSSDTADRRGALLDELVELERTGKDPARREQVIAELEQLWV